MSPEHILIAADMSQLELRIAAYMSRDPVMLDAFRQGLDLHTIMAQAAFGATNPDARKRAKVANFMIQYGGQEERFIEGVEKMILEQDLDMDVPTRAEARHIIQSHHRLHVVYWDWRETTIVRTRQLGYAETAFGRPRYLPDIKSPNPHFRAKAERQSIAHAISGTGADMLKMAQNHIARDEPMSSWGEMVLQVHDEILSRVDFQHRDAYAQRLETHMLLGQPFEPWVTLRCDIGMGQTWAQCHK